MKEEMNSPTEWFLVLGLNTKLEVINYYVFGRAAESETTVSPSVIFRFLLMTGSPAGALVHNHPSGYLAPSPEDKLMTMRLLEAAKILSIRLVDHVIVSPAGYVSIRDEFREEDWLTK